MLTLALRPLLRLVSSPTVAATAASWSINTMAGHVRELEARKVELDEANAELEHHLAELDAERTRILAELDEAIAALLDIRDAEPADGAAEPS